MYIFNLIYFKVLIYVYLTLYILKKKINKIMLHYKIMLYILYYFCIYYTLFL